jgi:hypothetical protein
MFNFAAAMLEWLPTGFNWAVLPVGLVLAALALRENTRPLAATGFLVAAAFSAALLSLLLAASVFRLLGYGRALIDLLLNFGPTVTTQYIATLAHENGPRFVALAPMVLTTGLASVAAIYLRRVHDPQ